MKEIEIGAFAKLHDLIENYDERTVIYRGMKSRNLPLLPKIGRIIPPESAKSRERSRHYPTSILCLTMIGIG